MIILWSRLAFQPFSMKSTASQSRSSWFEGGRSHLAEVIGGLDNAFAEVVLPDPVHDDSSRQRIITARQPIAEG